MTRRAAAVLLATLACSGQQSSERVTGTGGFTAAELASASAFAEPERCAGCHPGQVAEWQRSRHAAAWRDPIFQDEYSRTESPWCVGCHAPLAPDPGAPDDRDGRVAQGVGCAGCHLREGQLVSQSRAPDSPHATVIDLAFGTAEWCASCHEFNFPILDRKGRLERYTDEPMQATVSQFEKGGFDRALTCNDCHALSPYGHAFPGSHQPDMVRGALSIDVCADGTTLQVTLTNRGAGHNLPTGGVHRRMVLRIWRSTAPERVAELELGRQFRPRPDGGKDTIADTTLPPGGTRTLQASSMALGGSPVEPINMTLRYIYAERESSVFPGAVTSRAVWTERLSLAELAGCEVMPRTARSGSSRQPRR